MNRLKITFDIQHQGHAARVKLHGKDEFLYASFFSFQSNLQRTECCHPNLQLLKMGQRERNSGLSPGFLSAASPQEVDVYTSFTL